MVSNRYLINSAKRLFQPLSIVPLNTEVKRELLPKSQMLMLDFGIIRQASNGLYHILPLGLRALDKLKGIVDRHMAAIGAQKLQLPILTEGSLWKSSNRWDATGEELFKIKDRRNKDYLLSPTHEESITQLIASLPTLSHNQLPLLLYQITEKFRDEIKPRCGLVRCREFTMKDMYSFDTSTKGAMATYNSVCNVYENIFNEIGLPIYKVDGDVDNIGGDLSHEYHVPVDIGEDVLSLCDKCSTGFNVKLSKSTVCLNCTNDKLRQVKGIEVGHTFLLGTKYSLPLMANFKSHDGTSNPLVMGCYGLGLTRILAAAIEYLSVPTQIRWPYNIAPFTVAVVTPKGGSKEADHCGSMGEEIYQKLEEIPGLSDNVILDDRDSLSIGRRMFLNQSTGYPYVVVIGRKAVSNPPIVELHTLGNETPEYLSIPELIEHFTNNSTPHLSKNVVC